MRIVRVDHVQLAMPPGEEETATAFYQGLLGLGRVPKPPHLEVRGGCWFEDGPVRIHLGVDQDFRPARKAHPALVVEDLSALVTTLTDASVPVSEGAPLEGYARVDVEDPFGNRLELMAPVSTPT